MNTPHPRHEHADDDFERGLAFDMQTLISRRRALLTLGGAGLGILGLAACGSDDADSSAAASSTDTAGTSGTSNTASASTAISDASGSSAACVDEIPNETQGPYPGDGSNGINVLTEDGIVRSDITASFGSSSTVADGIPLEVVLTIQDSDGCAPIPGAAVYLWHCDADGNYSLYSDGITGENYLRGVQEADANGQVRFNTIVPGCYSGRWPHIHFEVYDALGSATAGSNSAKTSQLAFPQAACETAYADSRYPTSASNLGQITLSSDNVFSDDSGALQMATMSGSNESGYTAALVVGV